MPSLPSPVSGGLATDPANSPEKPQRQPKIATPVAIQNVRGREGDFTLDKHGFQYVKHTSKLEGFDDDALVRREHYAELEAMLRDVLENTKGL